MHDASCRAPEPDPYTVPPVLSLFPGQTVDAPFAGQVRPLADMKWVRVADGRNAAADFHLYTEVPKAARGVGFVLNDLGAEFNQASPNFGEKLAAPWLPISIRDWAGTEISRVYSDEYGTYNFLVPSTYSAHVPMPAGVSANMMTIVLNDPLLPDGTVDPFYNPMYVTAPWTFHYMPGGLSYLDTPIVPQAAFTTAEKRIDTEPQDHEPVIKRVDGPETGGGPWIRRTGGGTTFRRVTIQAMGPTPVINPDYDSNIPGSPMNIVRDYGFGTMPGSVTLCGNILTIVSWSSQPGRGHRAGQRANRRPAGYPRRQRPHDAARRDVPLGEHQPGSGFINVPAEFATDPGGDRLAALQGRRSDPGGAGRLQRKRDHEQAGAAARLWRRLHHHLRQPHAGAAPPGLA